MHRFSIFCVGSLLIGFAFAAPVHAQIRVDGEALRLTNTDWTYLAPRWSPDGSQIALSGDGYGGIYVIDVESGAVRTITEAPGAGYGFSWAPTGASILARVAHFDGPRRSDALTVFDVGSGSEEQLTEFRNDLSALPRWDESGGRVFLYANERLEVFVLEEDMAFKTAAAERPEWIAAGTGLANVSLAREEVQPASLFDDQNILSLTPSPDGSRLAFEVMGGNLFVMNVDGTGLTDLGPGNRPTWSPDGEWVAFTRTEDDGHTFTSSDLYAVRADGSAATRLTDTPGRLEMNPDWSPDGSHIAFDDFADGAVYVLPVAR